MKIIIWILLFFSTFCFAQEEKSKINTPVKPSTTDCPTWNKKDKKKDKASYFQSLRSNKTKVNQQTTSNPNNYRDSKIQPNTIPQKTEYSNKKINVIQTGENTNTEKSTILKIKEKQNSPVISSKNNTSNAVLEKRKGIAKQEKKVKKETEKQISPSKAEEIKVDNKSKDQKIDGKKMEVTDKTENSKIKKKLERMSKKTTKVSKHSNAKCPSF